MKAMIKNVSMHENRESTSQIYKKYILLSDNVVVFTQNITSGFVIIIVFHTIQMDLEVLHISQLYECIACCGVLCLLIGEFLAGYNKLWGHIISIKTKQQEEEGIWMRSTLKKNQEESQLDKTAQESLRREMSDLGQNAEPRKTLERDQSKQKITILQFLSELNPTQKTILLFHTEYGGFVTEHVALILPLMVLGIITNSVGVFSLACFFCFLFACLLFDFMHLQERLKAEYKKGLVLRRIVRILSSGFMIGIFISFWASREFSV